MQIISIYLWRRTLESGFTILDSWRKAHWEYKPEHGVDLPVRMGSGLGQNDLDEHNSIVGWPKELASGRQNPFPFGAFMMSWTALDKEIAADENHLPLWREYGSSGNGMVLACQLRADVLSNAQHKVRCIRIVYCPDAERLADEAEDELLALAEKLDREDFERGHPLNADARRAIELAAICRTSWKHPDWHDENEFRLVFVPDDFDLKSGEMQTGFLGGAVRLHCRAVVPEAAIQIKEIIIGGGVSKVDLDSAKRMAEWNLAQMGKSGFRVIQSQLKYRGRHRGA